MVIAPTVTFLVNLSLSTASDPDEWKKARIVPLYKSGVRENMDNYKAISIRPVLSKNPGEGCKFPTTTVFKEI